MDVNLHGRWLQILNPIRMSEMLSFMNVYRQLWVLKLQVGFECQLLIFLGVFYQIVTTILGTYFTIFIYVTKDWFCDITVNVFKLQTDSCKLKSIDYFNLDFSFDGNKLVNFRYIALNMLLKVVSVDTQAVQRHKITIVECVKVCCHDTS